MSPKKKFYEFQVIGWKRFISSCRGCIERGRRTFFRTAELPQRSRLQACECGFSLPHFSAPIPWSGSGIPKPESTAPRAALPGSWGIFLAGLYGATQEKAPHGRGWNARGLCGPIGGETDDHRMPICCCPLTERAQRVKQSCQSAQDAASAELLTCMYLEAETPKPGHVDDVAGLRVSSRRLASFAPCPRLRRALCARRLDRLPVKTSI